MRATFQKPGAKLGLHRLKSMSGNKILIVDEDRFAKVCTALLHLDGFLPEHIVRFQELTRMGTLRNFGLVITSYPYGIEVLNELKNKDIPVIVLSDCIDSSLLICLKQINNSFCMIKPIDFGCFSDIVQNLMFGKVQKIFGYEIH